MGKLKKYELLEKAMRDYPAGTKFKTIAQDGEVTSTGLFSILYGDVMHDNRSAVYTTMGNVWAEIISDEKPSLLSGKCAIQVNNEREFKLLMEHYEGKGWVWASMNKPLCSVRGFDGDDCVDYHNKFGYTDRSIAETLGYKIIPFADFAKEIGIEVPVFVMTSEDGVAMYRGDEYFRACLIEGEWGLTSGVGRFTANDPIQMPAFKSAWFSTKEAAEKWIAEHNKPKEISIDYGCETSCVITRNRVVFNLTGMRFELTSVQLGEVYSKHKSLQP